MRVFLFLVCTLFSVPVVFSQSKIYQFDLSISETRGASLADGLKSSDFDIQLRAAQQAATWGKQEHIQDLIFLLFNVRNSVTLPKHYETMAAAAFALGQIEGSNVQQVEALQQTILNVANEKLVKQSWMALGKLLPETSALGVRLEDAYKSNPTIHHNQFACLALAVRKRINQDDFVKSILDQDEILSWEEESRVALAQVLSRTEYSFISKTTPVNQKYKIKVRDWIQNEKSKYVRIQFARLANRYEWWTLLNDLIVSDNQQVAEAAVQQAMAKDTSFSNNLFWYNIKEKSSSFNYMRLGIHFNQFNNDQIRSVLKSFPDHSYEQVELAGVWNEKGHPDAQNFIMFQYTETEDLLQRISWVKQMKNSYLFIDSLVIQDFPTAAPALQTAITECVLEYAKTNVSYNEILFPGLFAVLWTSQDAGVLAMLAAWVKERQERFVGNEFLINTIQQSLPLFEKTETIETYNELASALNAIRGTMEPVPMLLATTHPFPTEKEWQRNRKCRVKIRTTAGTLVVKLNGENAPESVANLLSLSNKGYYNNIAFHRVVPNFVVQAGCTRGDGNSGMPYVISSEFIGHNFEPLHIGMASAGTHTESGQWFITSSYASHLNGRYTEFGEVVRGKKRVADIHVGTKILKMKEQLLF